MTRRGAACSSSEATTPIKKGSIVKKNRPDRRAEKSPISQGTDGGKNKIDEDLHAVTGRDVADEPERTQEEDRCTAATRLRRPFHICRIERASSNYAHTSRCW